MTDDTTPAPSGIYRSRRIPRGGGGPRRRLLLWVAAALVAAFGVGYLVTALVFFPSSDRPPIVAVPDLRDAFASDAVVTVEDEGLRLVVGDSLPNPRIPEGQILAQAPLPGEEVAPGTEIRVIVSAGAEQRAVPVVASMTRDQAIAALTASGFDVDLSEVEDLRAAGRVVGVEPAAGTEIRIPARVRLIVSSGPPIVDVPDLYGLTEDGAREILDDVGLVVGSVDHRFGGFDAEEAVVGQNPLAGASIEAGSTVDLIISSNRLPGVIIR